MRIYGRHFKLILESLSDKGAKRLRATITPRDFTYSLTISKYQSKIDQERKNRYKEAKP